MMKDLKQILSAALLLCVLAAGVLANDMQREQRDPPPKEPKVVVKEPKEQPREQPRNSNDRDKPKDDRRRP